MRFTLSFAMDNDAFDGGDNSADEVVRILHVVADRIDNEGVFGPPSGLIQDVNGNAIGRWGVTDNE